MNTERLYYSACYLTEFSANIIELADEGRCVYLDRTAFYPTSGGQPHDLGTLAGQAVTDVLDEGYRIAHMVAAPLKPGPVNGAILWPRRYDYMQQHTGQHLLSAVFIELFGFSTLSFHMGDEVSTIELATKELTEDQLARAEVRAQELARRAATVQITIEDAQSVVGLRKPSDRSGPLRVVEIPQVDKSACGGTHVHNLAETLPIQIRKLEKVRGNVRLEFVCGARATRRARQDFGLLQELARLTAAPLDKLPEQIGLSLSRLQDAGKERQRLTEELAKREGTAAYQATAPSADGIRRVRFDVDQVNETARTRCLACVEGSKAVALAVGKQPLGVMVACSADSVVDAGAVLKEAIAECGAGRGGGSASLAQGSLLDDQSVQILARKLGW